MADRRQRLPDLEASLGRDAALLRVLHAALLTPDIGDVRLAVIDMFLTAAANTNPNDFDAMALQYLEVAL